MKYNIISIDDSRQEYKDRIREIVNLDEVSIPAIDGREVDLHAELEKRGLRLFDWNPTKGELGVWLSTFDCWQWAAENEDLIVFEDDAIPTGDFNYHLADFVSELPEGWDFLSLWVPENQYHDYLYVVKYDSGGQWIKVADDTNAAMSRYNYGAIRLAKVYQGYGNVATLYSKDGAQRLIDAARDLGLRAPIDCWIMDRAHTDVVQGFAPKPMWAKAVYYDWAAETTVHNTERL